MDENKEVFLIKLAKDLQKQYMKGHIYCANIIEELHANENAHSRILRMLLQYKKDGKYPLLNSFVSKFIKKNPILNNPSFSNEEGRIDVLIHDKRTAIIIENKICGAVDQDKQLERYIQKANNYNCCNIFVIYLTKDGSKKVSDYSLNPKTREEMASKGNFIAINYKEDILCWILEQKENICISTEPLLLSALTQYADYLERMLKGTNDEDIKLNNKINGDMKEQLGLDSIEAYFNAESDINQLLSRIANEKFLLQKDLMKGIEDKICDKIKAANEHSQYFNWNINCSFEDKFFKISFGKFCTDNSELIICSENERLYSGIRKPENASNEMIELTKKLSLRSNEWWYCWRWMNLYCNQSTFWENLDSDEMAQAFISEAKWYLNQICNNDKSDTM